MRTIQESGFAPLADEAREAMLRQHIPYRVQLLNDAARCVRAQNQQDNQAFEAGVISGRILLSFLGLGIDRKTGNLRSDRNHDEHPEKTAAGERQTDDVKVRDVGGRFVDLNELAPEEKSVLAQFIFGVHKACAHFTLDSQHQLTADMVYKARPIILRLLREHLSQVK